MASPLDPRLRALAEKGRVERGTLAWMRDRRFAPARLQELREHRNLLEAARRAAREEERALRDARC
jgi:hypothetical protein